MDRAADEMQKTCVRREWGIVVKLSTKGKYGLRAMIDLAQFCEDDAVSIGSISQRQNISESYLEQLVAKLRRAGLVTGIRGAQGGYRLALPADQISVGDILRALEGDLEAVQCSAGKEKGCGDADLCVAKYVWQKINESIAQTVDEIMLDQLVDQSRLAQRKKLLQSAEEDSGRDWSETGGE